MAVFPVKVIVLEKPWILVFLTSGRRFFHNLENRLSQWNCPNENIQKIYDGLDPIKILVLTAKARGWKYNLSNNTSNSQDDKRKAKIHLKDNDNEKGRENIKNNTNHINDIENNEDEDIDEAEDIEDYSIEESDQDENLIEFDENDIQWQLDAMTDGNIEEEENNNNEETYSVDNSENIGKFKTMLSESNINPYNTWEMELNKVVNDERYLLLNSFISRENVFQEWAKNEIQKKKENNTISNNDIINGFKKTQISRFLSFIEENATKKMLYIDFKRKFRKNPIFKTIEFPDRDKEKLFRLFIKQLKKSDEEKSNDLINLFEKSNLSNPLKTLPTKILEDPIFYAVPYQKRIDALSDFLNS